jgi:hypothetical protein
MARGFSIDDDVLGEIAASKAGVYNRSTSWEQPFWATMFNNPEIPQYLASNPDPIPVPANAPADAASLQLRYSRYVVMPRPGDRHLYLFMFPAAPRYGQALAIRIPDKVAPGLTWIGDIGLALGPEWVFAAGNDVESRHPGRDKYLLVPFQEAAGGGRVIQIPSVVYGLGETDALDFRFELQVDGKVVASSDWQRAPRVDLSVPPDSTGKTGLTMYVRNAATGATYSANFDPASTQPVLLSTPGK